MGYVLYTTVSGETRRYDYPLDTRPLAADQCRRSLRHAGELVRVSKAIWRAGTTGRRFYDCTVQELIRRGIAVVEGDKVRLA